MALIDQQIAYYQGLLLAEYADSPRALQTIAIYVKQALGDMLAAQLDAAFTLGTAVGPQLDVLGKYIGISRNIGLPVAQPFYQFSDYNGPSLSPYGFTDYLVPATNAGVIWDDYLFQGTRNTALSDTAYYFMLKMQIVLNSNDGTLSSIMKFLNLFFPGQIVLVDNKNMTITYALGSQIPVPPAVLQPYLPKPLGVSATFLNLNSVTIPSTLSANGASHVIPFTVTTTSVTAAPSAGTPPYAYSWQFISGTLDPILNLNPLVVPTAPSAATTAFSYTRPNASLYPATATAVYQCVATDANGIPFISNTITVTITATHI